MSDNKSLPLHCLKSMKFHPCPCKDFLNPTGVCFEPDSKVGEGYYWFYEQPDMFTVAQMDLTTYDDCFMEYVQPDFISVNYYETISAEELSPYKRLNAHCIRSHISKGELFRLRCRKNIPVRGYELMLMPGYYKEYLNQMYPGEFSDPREAFVSIDGCTDFPELVLVLKQISGFKGEGSAAELYYRSKTAEALSLIIERSKHCNETICETTLYKQDKINLDAVKSYIDDHFAFDIKAEQLAAVACMGQTKMRASFKQVYKSTITEYIQNKRIAYAEYLLVKTDFSVEQTAKAVGYRHCGRFAALFKKNTGFSPAEYRKIIK